MTRAAAVGGVGLQIMSTSQLREELVRRSGAR
eukprot:SAG25_NODE_8662_length_410_cov_0.983923_1_plen_31_part_01